MPLLTDRQEPEDLDPKHPDDPDDYAIRYLFNPNNSHRDLARAARILLYSSAASNLLAFLLYLAWVELQFTALALALAALVVGLSGWAGLSLKNGLPLLARRLGWLPLPLTLLSLLLLSIFSEENALLFTFFLPGSLTIWLASFLLTLSHQTGAEQ